MKSKLGFGKKEKKLKAGEAAKKGSQEERTPPFSNLTHFVFEEWLGQEDWADVRHVPRVALTEFQNISSHASLMIEQTYSWSTL